MSSKVDRQRDSRPDERERRIMGVEQVAEQLGVTPRRVRALIAAGRVEAIQGLSTDELARAAGVSVSDVRRLDRGLPMSTPSTARRVLDVLGVEPTALPDLHCR